MSCEDLVIIPLKAGEDADVLSFEYLQVADDATETPQDLDAYTSIVMTIERADGESDIELTASIDDADNGLFSFALPLGGLPLGQHYANVEFTLVSGRSFYMFDNDQRLMFDVEDPI